MTYAHCRARDGGTQAYTKLADRPPRLQGALLAVPIPQKASHFLIGTCLLPSMRSASLDSCTQVHSKAASRAYCLTHYTHLILTQAKAMGKLTAADKRRTFSDAHQPTPLDLSMLSHVRTASLAPSTSLYIQAKAMGTLSAADERRTPSDAHNPLI